MARTHQAVMAVVVVLAAAGCSGANRPSVAATTARPAAPPFVLTVEEIRGRLIEPVEVLGTGARAHDLDRPRTGQGSTELGKRLRDPRAVLTCGLDVLTLSRQAGPVERRMYATEIRRQGVTYMTHSWRITVAVYPSAQAAQVDAERLARPPGCPARRTVPLKRWPGGRFTPEHRQTWDVRPADQVHDWQRQRVIADSFFGRTAGGGDWGHLYTVHDVATRGRVLTAAQYMTRTGDTTTTRVENEAAAALDVQVRRLAGEGACRQTTGGIECATGRRTARPAVGH